jgi:hypothetical protein
MHAVVCDNCGTVAVAALMEWLELRPADSEAMHFCTWECLGAFQVKRQREAALHDGEVRP